MTQKAIGSGLQNLGNTCFFNATLQSVLYAPPLAALFEKHTHSGHCLKKNSTEWCVFCEMERIYNSSRQARTFSPNNMIKNLSKIFKKFKLGRQEDSHEFLRYLVEGMQDSETGKLGKDREENEKKLRRTRVFEVFGGVVKTVVECLNCSRKSVTTERYYDFNIECQRASSLHEGVASHFAVDKLEGSNKYLCEFCKVRSNAQKRFLLDSVPQVATFQLKRFTNSMRKIGKFIQYPLEIDLGKYLDKPQKIVMKLYAVIVHLGGSSFSGHYFAFVRQGSNWYKMDDGYVSKCNLETVMAQQAYILFYEKEQSEQTPSGLEPVSEQVELPVSRKPREEGSKPREEGNKPREEGSKPREEGSKPREEVKPARPESVVHNGKKRQQSLPPSAGQKLVVNGTASHESKLNGKIQSSGLSSAVKQIPDTLMQDIESLLVRKLSKADVFKNIKDEDHQISDTISKAVKEVILQIVPKKNEFENRISEESLEIEMPSLKRKKSKVEMERELPYGDLILRTFDKIMELRAKMPLKRPHNHSQRSMYNLRDYETKMQKRRKIG